MRVLACVIAVWTTVTLTGCAGKRPASDFAAMEKRVPRGATAYVTTNDGTEFRGRVASVSRSSVKLSLRDATTRDFRPADVSTIRLKDPIWNGLLIGGGVSGLVSGLFFDEGCVAPYAAPGCQKVSRAETIAISAAAGAAIGAGIDVLHHRRVYRGARPGPTTRLLLAPLVTPTAVSFRVSLLR